MDKLKEYWEVAKKQHFWILCGFAILAPFIASWMANNYLSKVYADQKTKIASTNSKLDSLLNGDHANPEWVKHLDEETERLRTNVLHAWETLYKKQETALKWPPELRADFIAAFEQPASKDDPRLLEPLCERYQNFVKTELSHMADIVKAEWDPAEGQGGGAAGHGDRAHRGGQSAAGGAPAGNPDESKKNYIVTWDAGDQERLVAAYDWQDPPSPLDVRYAQEELWVLEAICKAIDRTNVGATGDFDAVVREIHSTLIGYDATNKFPLGEGSGRIDRTHKTGPGAGAPQQPAPQAGPAAATLEPKRPMRHRTNEEGALGGQFHPHRGEFGHPGVAAPAPGVPAGPADPDDWLKDGRYVDSKGKPLLGSEWAASTSPEYNQMAFKLTIVADEQRWQKLLLELCNSPLPLEVREVRINPSDRDEGGGGGRGRPGRRQGDQEGGNSVMHNVTLEIDGVAYLVNPPNLAKLGIKAADASAGPAAPANVAPPATTTPAAAPTTTPATPATETPPTPSTTPAPTTPAIAAPPPTTPPTASPPAVAPATGTPATTTPATAPPVTTTPPTTAPPTTVPRTTVPPTTAPPVTAPSK